LRTGLNGDAASEGQAAWINLVRQFGPDIESDCRNAPSDCGANLSLTTQKAAKDHEGTIEMQSSQLPDPVSFLAFGPYGPIYIEFELAKTSHVEGPGSQTEFDHQLSANGWPVQRVAKGRYKVFAYDKCFEVVSDHPMAL
jgi:hypothetical protein